MSNKTDRKMNIKTQGAKGLTMIKKLRKKNDYEQTILFLFFIIYYLFLSISNLPSNDLGEEPWSSG
jgi:hypothetical protein